MLKTALHTETSIAESSFSLIKQAGIVIGASAVIAVCARLVLPLPYTPVPLTLANFGVLLIGLTLGSRRGFAAAALYLAWGAMGLPVFSPVGPGGLAQIVRSHGGLLVGVSGCRLRGRMDRRARAIWICAQPDSRRDCRVGAVRGRPELAGRDDAQLATRCIFRFVSVPGC